jgi:dihydrolipoamide dehydrogenase
MDTYDIIVIGAGPGGYIAALKAASCGARVAIVEKGSLGGTCLNLGCIPTKTLYQASQRFADYLEYASMLKDPFVRKGDLAQRAFSHAMETKNRVIASLRKQVNRLVKLTSIDVYRGSACLSARNEVTINRSDKIHARAVIVATGSTPVIPPRFDIDRTRVMTSNEILSIDALPESILIVGGGYIGCEYASIFSNFGVAITLVELLPKILNTEDDDVVN